MPRLDRLCTLNWVPFVLPCFFMVPMPENISPAKSIDEAIALYEQFAKSHNKILAEYLLLKEQNDWIQKQLFCTRSERFIPIPQEQQTLFSSGVDASNGYDVTVTPILDPAC
jgi:hypothetical protein